MAMLYPDTTCNMIWRYTRRMERRTRHAAARKMTTAATATNGTTPPQQQHHRRTGQETLFLGKQRV